MVGDIMGLITKVFNAIDTRSQMKKFEEDANCLDCIVKAQNFPQFKAIRNKEESVLYIPFDKYVFRQNDQIIDIRDISYYVKDVEPKFEYKLGDYTYIVNKVIYEERPLLLPNYITQTANNNITINVNDANLRDINANNTTNQQIDFAQILQDLENAVNNCYHIQEYRKMVSIIKDDVQQQKPIEESKIKKFFKFMGTQIKNLVDVFIATYAKALANK